MLQCINMFQCSMYVFIYIYIYIFSTFGDHSSLRMTNDGAKPRNRSHAGNDIVILVQLCSYVYPQNDIKSLNQFNSALQPRPFWCCFPTHPSGSLYSHFKKQSSITARYPKYLAILKHKLFFSYIYIYILYIYVYTVYIYIYIRQHLLNIK